LSLAAYLRKGGQARAKEVYRDKDRAIELMRVSVRLRLTYQGEQDRLPHPVNVVIFLNLEDPNASKR